MTDSRRWALVRIFPGADGARALWVTHETDTVSATSHGGGKGSWDGEAPAGCFNPTVGQTVPPRSRRVWGCCGQLHPTTCAVAGLAPQVAHLSSLTHNPHRPPGLHLVARIVASRGLPLSVQWVRSLRLHRFTWWPTTSKTTTALAAYPPPYPNTRCQPAGLAINCR